MEAVGIYKDGNELKIAHLIRRKRTVEIIGLEKIFLKSDNNNNRLQEVQTDTQDDAFGLNAENGIDIDTEPSGTGYELFLRKFTKYANANLRIGLNIPQEDSSVTKIVSNIDSAAKNIRTQLKNELESVTGEIELENFNYLPGKKNEYLLFYHNSKLEFMEDVFRARKDLKSDFTVSLLDANEISLVNLFRNTVNKDTRRSILVYIGNEFSRILFMQDRNLVNVSQIINEGYHSTELLDNLYGKIVYEADSSGFEDFRSIYISGEGDCESYKKFFMEKFPDCEVDRLKFEDRLIVNEVLRDTPVNGYCIPVSIAWKILSGKDDEFIDTNFLPARIKKLQNPVIIAWHGLVLAAGLALTLAYLYFGAKSMNREIRAIENQTVHIESNIDEIAVVANKADSIQSELNMLAPKIALIDSLKTKTIYFSELLRYTAGNVCNINSLWLKEFTASGKTFSVSGNSLYRNRIYQFANIFERSRINIVDNGEIREKKVYPYNITGEIPDKMNGEKDL